MIDPNTGLEIPQDPANPDSGVAAVSATTPDAGAVTPDSQGMGVKTVPLAALQDERQKRQDSQAQLSAIQQEMQQLRQMIGTQQQQPQYGQQAPVQQQPQVNPVDSAWNNEEAWNRDPKQAVRQSVQAEIIAALQWYDSQAASISQQEAQVMQKYPDYGQYKARVDQHLRSVPFGQRNQPGMIEATYFMLRGQNVDQLLTAQQQGMIDRIKRGEFVQGLNPGTTGAPMVQPGQTVQLSEDQMKVAAMMNLTPEAYASAIVGKK